MTQPVQFGIKCSAQGQRVTCVTICGRMLGSVYCKSNASRTAERFSTAAPFSMIGSKRHFDTASIAASSKMVPGVDSRTSTPRTSPLVVTTKLTSADPVAFLRCAARGYLGAT